MHRQVNAIAGRLSLRAPQRRSLEILDRIAEILPPTKNADRDAALSALSREFPTVTDFEREFPSFCFALATGVGKTRLMGAFITYLHLAHGINNFFVLAPNLTIYNKLIADFTPNTPKYVFKGIAEFATDAPEVITGETYRDRGTLLTDLITCRVNVFNISKINSEVRGGKSPKIKQLSEYLGQSYYDYLAGLGDLVILMDESHRYRASAGIRAINELRPVMGLELTATPFVETSKGSLAFKNVIFDYPLGRALADGFVKEPAVVTRKDFKAAGMAPEAIERLKLEDGIRVHESVKVELETYARESGREIVKPFMLIIARDTTHAAQLVKLLQTELFEGRYASKVIQVDSSRTGAEEDEMVERLLKVEHTDEPTEIVVHVNMLKEGWDVTNLYTIVPLRAANARVLIEQSIGRGLRLPYGVRTGVTAVDRLNIIAHDKFQEIVDEASRPGSQIRIQQVILPPESANQKTISVVSQSNMAAKLGLAPASSPTRMAHQAGPPVAPVFVSAEDQQIAKIAYEVIRRLDVPNDNVKTSQDLLSPAVQSRIQEAVRERYRPVHPELPGISPAPNLADIVAKTAEVVVQQTIDIPRILVQPKEEVRTGFHPFTLKVATLQYAPPADEIWIQHLRTSKIELLGFGPRAQDAARPEDYVVNALFSFDDVDYGQHADVLYDLAGQVVAHLRTYLGEQDVAKVLRFHQREIGSYVHSQMLAHFWEDHVDYEVKISKGFTELKECAFTTSDAEPPLDFRQSPADKSNMARYLFGGFARCLYPVQKFQSDTERMVAVILERETIKWFKPAKGQFQIFYRLNGDQPEYQPDFVAETADCFYMLEPKARKEMATDEVKAKRDAALRWCEHATQFTKGFGGKPWKYALIPHDAVALNMTLEGLTRTR